MYASSRARTVGLAEAEAGVKIAKRMEATDPEDVTAEAVLAELGVGDEVPAAIGGETRGFARPKRPGRR